MLKMGLNDVFWALKVKICNLLHPKLDLAPKNLVKTSFLIIYTPFLLLSIIIDTYPRYKDVKQSCKVTLKISPSIFDKNWSTKN